MLRETILIMIALLASCWSYSPSTVRLRIDRSHINRISTRHGALSMSSYNGIPQQSVSYLRSIDDKQFSRQNKFVAIKKSVLTSLVRQRYLVSALLLNQLLIYTSYFEGWENNAAFVRQILFIHFSSQFWWLSLVSWIHCDQTVIDYLYTISSYYSVWKSLLIWT